MRAFQTRSADSPRALFDALDKRADVSEEFLVRLFFDPSVQLFLTGYGEIICRSHAWIVPTFLRWYATSQLTEQQALNLLNSLRLQLGPEKNLRTIYCTLSSTQQLQQGEVLDITLDLRYWYERAGASSNVLLSFTEFFQMAATHPLAVHTLVEWLHFYTQDCLLNKADVVALLNLDGWTPDTLGDLARLLLVDAERNLILTEILLHDQADGALVERIYGQELHFDTAVWELESFLEDRGSVIPLVWRFTSPTRPRTDGTVILSFFAHRWAELNRLCGENDSPLLRATLIRVGHTWKRTLPDLVGVCTGILADTTSATR